jgi:hypothetical protein
MAGIMGVLHSIFIKPFSFIFGKMFMSVYEIRRLIDTEKASIKHRESFYKQRRRLLKKNDELV